MAKKLTEAMLNALRHLATQGNEGDVFIDARTGEALVRRKLARVERHWTVMHYYIAKAGRDYLAALDTAPETASAAPAEWYAVSLPEIRLDTISTSNLITPVSFDEVMARTTQPGKIEVDDEVRYIGSDPLPEGIAPDATGSVIMIIEDETAETHLVRFEGMSETDERLTDLWFDPAELVVVIPAARALRRELNTLRWEHADLIAERDALVADRRRLVAALERFKRVIELMHSVDGQYDIQEKLREDTGDLTDFGEWLALMDSDSGVMAEVNRTGIYADDDRPLLDTMLNGEDS